MQVTTQLVEVSMAVVNGFDPLEDWLNAAEAVGLSLVEKRDLSFAIMPNLINLQRLSQRYFRLFGEPRSLSGFYQSTLLAMRSQVF